MSPYAEPAGYIDFMQDDDCDNFQDNYRESNDCLVKVKRTYVPGNVFHMHGHSLASATDGTMLWCWVDEEDNGSLRVVRSTNYGGSWGWVAAPLGGASYGQPGLAVTTVAGVRTWVLVWPHFDRADHSGTGYLRASISSDDGNSWSPPQVLGFEEITWSMTSQQAEFFAAAIQKTAYRVHEGQGHT